MFVLDRVLFIYLLLFLSLLNNAKIILHFRLADLLFFVVFLLSLRTFRLNIQQLVWFFSLLFLGLLSSFINFGSGSNYEELVFYYKYIFFFMALFFFRSYVLNEMPCYIECYFKNKFYFASLKFVVLISIYLSFFVFFFVSSNIGMALGGATRVSIPFSYLDPGTSNAPAFSLVFALLIVFFDKAIFGFWKFLLIAMAASALILCGSRSGVFLIFIYFIFFSGNIKSNFLIIIPLISLCGLILSQYIDSNSLIFKLAGRALDFELHTDQSANQRLFKQFSSFVDTEKYYYLLGRGHENTMITWYDGMIGNLQTFGGTPVVLIFFILYLSVRKTRKKDFLFFDLLLISSFISEFLLTSYMVIFVLFLSMTLVTQNRKEVV